MARRTANEKVETAPGIVESGMFGPYKFISLVSGRKITFTDAMREVETGQTTWGRGMSRMFKLANADWDLEAIERRLDKMEEHIGALRHYMSKIRDRRARRERIAQLRNTSGRNEVEIALFNKKADEMERELEEEERKERMY